MTFKPSIERILNIMNHKGYRIYDTPGVDWNLNLVGIRATPASGDVFDDVMVVFHRLMGEWDVAYYPMSADPSSKYLRSPINNKGCAILKAGQYRSTYKIDIHRRGKPGGHKALCQKLGPVTVYRDDTRDGKLNLVGADPGYHGINIHRGPRNGTMDTQNDIYSAGCQVFADDRHFADFMQKCECGRDAFGDSFTYTLLDQSDFG